MSTAATAPKDKLDQVIALAQGIAERQRATDERLAAVEKAAQTPAYNVPNVVRNGVRDSAGYSILKAIAFVKGWISPDDAKEELHVHKQLKSLYVDRLGYQTHFGHQAFLAPYSTMHMPYHLDGARALALEIRQKMLAGGDKVDPDEGTYIRKAMGTTSDLAGGTLVGFPTLGELIDLQRNMEVFARAGATEIALPGNGLMDFPKLSGGSTAYWVGEGAGITASDQTTGDLKLVGKKLGVLTKINNELFRYANPTAEAMIRGDMAAQAALKADLAQLEGTGGTQPKGLITYTTSSSWTQGTDNLLSYSVTSNVFQPEDVYKMLGKQPDPVQSLEKTFVMRNDMWGAVASRRADAVSAADAKGPFVFNITREMGQNIPPMLNGYKVVTSSQVSGTRDNGSRTYIICGAFRDWITARFGVVEFKMSDTGDTPLVNDQTWLRAIQILDAGPRHAASFVFADAINIA
jgi:HK97 family phage major capsid protein